MVPSSTHEIPFSAFVLLFFLCSPIFPAKGYNKTFASTNHLNNKMKLINAYLNKINKPYVKSIKSIDGEIIDCVPFHLQPAFDHPEIKRTLRVDPPDMPNGHSESESKSEVKQLWSLNGESCPNGTIPIRRTSASDILKFDSISKFGKKIQLGSKFNKRGGRGHERATGSVSNGEFHGAKGILNVWAPKVASMFGYSLSQIWVRHEAPLRLVNSIEAGWQVYPFMYKDNSPRLFIYWTSDGYNNGCYNLLCSGFVQTNREISLGGALTPVSTYNGPQFDITILIWKGPISGNWWLRVGTYIVGYWPSILFPDLSDNATLVEYGGEAYGEYVEHTATEMGSGHFPTEGYGKAAFVKDLEVADNRTIFIPASNLDLKSDHPSCYDVKTKDTNNWGNYIYFGGPGKSLSCV